VTKISILSIVILLLFGCGTDRANEIDTEVLPKENTIRIEAESIGWDTKVPCKIIYHGKQYKAKLKFRGGMSSRYPKHSMTVEFKKNVSIAGMPSNDDWIFNASYIDKTFQRHKLSYDIFRLMNEENKAPRSSYLPVYLNDKYMGLYVIMEKVNGSWLGFDKKNPEGARLFKDPFIFVKERLPNVQEPDNYYQQKFPKQKNEDCNHELDDVKRFLFESSDEEFIQANENWFVRKNVIDWHLLLLLTNNDDGVVKNFYLYREPNGRPFQFIPWDYDHSFGRDGNYDLNLAERLVRWEKAILLKRLMEIPGSQYPHQLKQRYNELRKSIFTEETLFELIAANSKEIRPYLDANEAKWALDAKWYSDANNYDQEIELIKKYISLRLEQLDTFFSTLEYGKKE